MKNIFNNFVTSGFDFTEIEMDLKGRYQMVNAGLFLSTIGLIFGIIGNIIRDQEGFIAVEISLLCINFFLIYLFRKDRKYFNTVVITMTTQFTFLFLFLVYVAEPESMKHIWLFSYPIILLYLQDSKKGMYWMFFVIVMLLVAPLQNIIEVKYSIYQVTYLSFVLIIVHTIIYFYQQKMDEAKNKILEQQFLLLNFNNELEKQVNDKTSELKELNESLEIKVQEKLDELLKRDRILESQSKQAVMGEMINMIAHQWRQPLSTITLQISHLQFKKMLGQEIDDDNMDNVLTQISDTIIYLSDTIDDFLTYFHPDKDANDIELHELLQKAINLALPKAKKVGVEIFIDRHEDIELVTYINEFVQVVVNLLNNAVDALSECDKEELKIKIVTQMKGANVIINVIDNANGISDENILHLFEPYFSTKGKNGTGLGLYMSQMIVQKQLNGSLDVSSSKNGSIFTITIPNYIE